MKISKRVKVYSALILSLLIIPIYYFILPVSHADWWLWFRLMNHAIHTLVPLINIIGYYGLFLKHKKSFIYLIIISLVGDMYIFNLDAYNIFISLKSLSFNMLKLGFEESYILLIELLVFIFTIFFNAEIIIRKNKIDASR